MKILKKRGGGGSREKEGGGNEIHAPCACDWNRLPCQNREIRGLLISEAILKHIAVHYQRTIGVGYQANIEKHLGF